jgi:poly-gamma-glutamate synthesis protein (capsule biosynthesis protein)
VKGIEVNRDKLILYGCGDFLNDYEGISGYREFRPELSLMYFPTWDGAAGRLAGMRMLPMRTHRFRSVRAGRADAEWLAALLNREGRRFGTRAEMEADGALALRWE